MPNAPTFLTPPHPATTHPLLQANAEAAALINNIGAEQNAFSNLFQALNMTSADDINAFIFTQAIRETPSQVILGVTLPEQLKF